MKQYYKFSSLFLIIFLLTYSLLNSDSRVAAAEKNDELRELLSQEMEWLEAETYVYSASRRKERLFQTPAAAYVINQEDIRRSGATTIPELLRIVPGVHVSRIDASKWAVSVRGFGSRFSSKLLVLVDGRSIYTPTSSGVYWEVQDLLLEDIDRIEVIRGPGGTMWGSNAENGVINILTKHSADTQGIYIEGGGGEEERGFGGIRVGGDLGENLTYRFYGKYFRRDNSQGTIPEGSADDWDSYSGGLRLDWQPSSQDQLTITGNLYDFIAGTTRREVVRSVPPPPPSNFIRTIEQDHTFRGGNLTTTWNHQTADHGNFTLQMYYEEYDNNVARDLNDHRRTFDIDIQHQLAIASKHEIVWGGGYRTSKDEIVGTDTIFLSDANKTLDLYNVFVQDRITLQPNRLYFTIGSKFEHNDFTGSENQPSARLAWTPAKNQIVWLSVARAVRVPSRSENSIVGLNGRLPNRTLLAGLGNPDVESEQLTAYEFGYRVQPTSDLSLEFAAFYNDYHDLVNARVLGPTVVAGVGAVVAIQVNNDLVANAYGVELNAEYIVTDYWRLSANYSYLDIEVSAVNAAAIEEQSPDHMANLTARIDLPWNLEFDTTLYYVDDTVGVPRLGTTEISHFFRLDARFGWQPTEQLEFSLVIQNALDPKHQEFRSTNSAIATEIERSVFGWVKCQF